MQINTALRINLLFNVDSKEETFQLDLFVNEYWVDPRLQFDSSKYPLSNSLRIPSKYTPWLPDTFFFNAVKCLAISDASLTLSPDGTVFWSRHQSCTFHSSFNLLNFPFDEQILAVRRTSFSYTDNELRLKFLTSTGWRPAPETDFTNSLWDFEYAFSNHSSLVFIDTHSANAYLAVSRRSTSYVLKMILPMCLLVLLSSLSYAVDPGSPPARVGFSVALVLSIVTFNLVVSQDLPKINYATLLDWYVWCCFMFVVLALGEYAAVNNMVVSKRFDAAVPFLVDDFAMWTMPVTWIVFNVCYWPIYNAVGLTIFLVMAWSAWMLLNVYRVRWNHVNNKRGLWAPTIQSDTHAHGGTLAAMTSAVATLAHTFFSCSSCVCACAACSLYHNLRRGWHRNDAALDWQRRQAALAAAAGEGDEDQEEEAAAVADKAVEIAAATGANVFEVQNAAAAALAAEKAQAASVAAASAASASASAATPSRGSADPALSGSDEPNPFDDESSSSLQPLQGPGQGHSSYSAGPHMAQSLGDDDGLADDGHYGQHYNQNQSQGGYVPQQDEEYEQETEGQGSQDLNLV